MQNGEFNNFCQLFELFPEPVIIGESTGKILYANRAVDTLFGYNKEEMRALSVFDIVTEEFTSRLTDIVNGEHEKQDGTFNVCIYSKNRESIPCEIKTAHIKYDGRSLRCMVLHDLSVKPEENSEEQSFSDAGRDSLSSFPGVIEEPEMAFELDSSGYFVSINDLCTEKTGYTKDDLKKKLHFYGTLTPEEGTRAMIDFKRLMQGEKLHALEYTIVKKDGSLLPVIVSFSKILFLGTILGVRGVALDISEHKRVEKERMVKEKLKALGEMTGGVVHNINNNLAIILGYTELFPQSGLDESCRSIIANIKQAALDGTEITKRIKDFSRISDQQSSREYHDINRIILEVIEFLKPRWDTPESGVSVITGLDDIPHVRIKPFEIREVLSNVIINALDAMPKGGKLTIRSFLENDHIAVCVEDTGTGMSDETKKHVFEVFYTTKKHGTGMGMFVSNDIVKNLGGRMLVESDEGCGTCITILLPGPAGAENSASSGNIDNDFRKPLRILVIDDEDNICEILREYLKREGHDAVTALNGERGLVLFRESHFDIVITDLNIPDFTGWDIAEQIRKEKPDTFIILLTGGGTKIDDFTNHGKNIDVILQKPINFTRLSEIIRYAGTKN